MTLLLVVLLLAIFLSIAAGTFQIAFTEYRLSGELSDSFRALYAADEGVERLFFYDRVLNGTVLGCSAWGACIGTPAVVDLGDGICMELRFSRDAAAQTTVTAVGEFRCGGSAVAVRRALEATYQKELNFGAALVAFWTFDWGTVESANSQNVEDVVSDDRTVVEANDGIRGSDSLPGGDIHDPSWVNPSGGPCSPSGNCALQFDGSDDYVSVPDAADGSLDPGQITIAAWVRIPSGPAPLGSVVAKGGNLGYRFRINNDRTVAWFDRGATNRLDSDSSAAVQTDAWTHIAVTGDTSGLKIYINGTLRGSKATPYGGPNTSAELNIGAEPALGEYFNGCIDNVKIWSTALSASEVQADHDSYAPGASC